jgi:hypothetical protein
MKKLFSAILIILFAASIASATHLTCDPQPKDLVTKYRIDLNGEILSAEIENVGENQVRIRYGIDHLGNGKYIVFAQAGNDKGEWSLPSNVLEFYRGVPTPQNIDLYCVTEEPARLSQKDWSVYYVSSEETKNEGLLAANAFDGYPKTQWHSSWITSVPGTSHPHEIQIDLGKEYRAIQGFYYLPRQDLSWNGTIKNFVFYVSVDGKRWTEVIRGEFSKTKKEQSIEFAPVSAKYISLVSLSEINGKEWTTIAELNVLGY